MNYLNKTTNNRLFVAGIILSIAGFSVSANTLPPLVTGLARRYAMNPGMFGIAFFFQYTSFAVFSFLSGYISGRGHAKPELILVGALVITGILLPFIGLIPSFPFFILFMVIIGGCGGLVETNGTGILSRCDTSPRGTYMHVSQLFYCLGALLAPGVVGLLQTGRISDGVIGLVVGALTLLLTIAVYLLVVSSMRKPGFNIGSGDVADSRADTEMAEPSLQVGRKIPLDEVPPEAGIRALEEAPPIRTFVWFLLSILLYVMIEISVGSWLPAYMEQSLKLTPAAASFHLTLYWTGLAMTRFIYIFVHSGSIRMQLALHVSGMVASVALLLLTSRSPLARAGAIVLLGASCGPVWPLIINLYSTRYTRAHWVMYMVGSGSIGALLGILISSTLLEYRGAGSFIALLAAYTLTLAAAYATLMLKTRRVRPSAGM